MEDKRPAPVRTQDNIVTETTEKEMRAAIKEAFPDATITTSYALDGVGFKVGFPNGYAGSVICHKGSYGGDDGLWEIAVMRQMPMGFRLCYDTPVTDDVIGFLDEPGVIEILKRIQKLEIRKRGKK